MLAIALALAASASWGVGDFLGGAASRRMSALTVLAVAEAAGLAAVAVLVAGLGAPAPSGGTLTAAGLAGLCGVLGLGALYRGMAIGAMGVVAPISASAAIIPVAVGLARGERPGSVQLAGVAVALAGVALASREPGAARGRVAAGVGLAALAALGFGSYIVFIDEAAEQSALWAVLVSRAVATVAAVAVAGAAGRLRIAPRALAGLSAIGLFDVGANALLAYALNAGLVSIVSVLASLYPVVTIALARVVLGERIARIQALGAAAALTGVALIASG